MRQKSVPGKPPAEIRNIVLAWVLTLPMAMMLSASLYLLFVHLF